MGFGRLESSARHRPMSDINVTPLVDVMLVLLVIFIVTAPIMTSQIDLDLPKAGVATTEKKQDIAPFVAINIDAKGQVYWGDEAMDAVVLRERFAQAAKIDKATELRLRADTAVAYGRVVQLIGMAQAAGLSRIGFVADPLTGEPLPDLLRKP